MFADGATMPKSLLTVNGVPLITRIINAAIKTGIDEGCCIINPRFTELADYLSSALFAGDFHLTIMQESTPSSMHSLFALSPFLQDGRFCLATTDSIFLDHEFMSFLRVASVSNADGVLAITNYCDDEKPLAVSLDDDMRITSFSDKLPDEDSSCIPWITGGIYCFSPRIFDLMGYALDNNVQRLRNYLRLLLQRNYTLRGFPFSKMIDVDNATDLIQAREFIAGSQNAHNV
jgi:NDP-sugar pyrophosphorylase family protein